MVDNYSNLAQRFSIMFTTKTIPQSEKSTLANTEREAGCFNKM